MVGATLLYILLLTAIANVESARDSGSRLTPALATLLPAALLIPALRVLLNGGGLTATGADSLRVVSAVAALVAALVMIVLIWAEAPWLWVTRIVSLLSRYEYVSFDPRNSLDRLAAIILSFALVALSWQATGFEGAAVTSSTDAIGAAPQLLYGALLYLALAVLGVGWLTRRDWAGVKRRLGLHRPRPADWMAGVSTGIALHLLVALATALWQATAEPSVFESQVSGARAIFEALSSSLLAGGLLAMGVGIGEEVLFRGALQPVFGMAISSLLFVALHTQYAFTPAAAILLVVSLGFGLLRARASTTAAIIAHAAYNAIPFVLAALR